MFCRKCGSSLNNDQKFCMKCGTKVEEIEGTTNMPNTNEIENKPVENKPVENKPVGPSLVGQTNNFVDGVRKVENVDNNSTIHVNTNSTLPSNYRSNNGVMFDETIIPDKKEEVPVSKEEAPNYGALVIMGVTLLVALVLFAGYNKVKEFIGTNKKEPVTESNLPVNNTATTGDEDDNKTTNNSTSNSSSSNSNGTSSGSSSSSSNSSSNSNSTIELYQDEVEPGLVFKFPKKYFYKKTSDATLLYLDNGVTMGVGYLKNTDVLNYNYLLKNYSLMDSEFSKKFDSPVKGYTKVVDGYNYIIYKGKLRGQNALIAYQDFKGKYIICFSMTTNDDSNISIFSEILRKYNS